jgi:hypothetical protein
MDGKDRGLICALCRNLPGGTEGNHEKPQVRIADVLVEIRTDHLPNTGQERYHYDNPFGSTNHIQSSYI